MRKKSRASGFWRLAAAYCRIRGVVVASVASVVGAGGRVDTENASIS
jgi:hypothetical protein